MSAAFVADSPHVDALTPSPNFNERPSPIDMVVLHYTGMPDGAGALKWLCTPEAQVSAHYLIEEDGRVFQLVAECRRAWHAGLSAWAGRARLNDCSIGIEIVNPGHAHGYRPFPAPQVASVVRLVSDIRRRHGLPVRRIVAHSDIAPTRKEDPGELFPWSTLANEGCVLPLPSVAERGSGTVANHLKKIGYDLSIDHDEAQLTACVAAFGRRFGAQASGSLAEASSLAIMRAAALATIADA